MTRILGLFLQGSAGVLLLFSLLDLLQHAWEELFRKLTLALAALYLGLKSKTAL